MNKLVLTLLIVIISGCTSVHVQKLDPKLKVSHMCIQKNPKVIVGDFLPVVRKCFERHGITTEVFDGEKPKCCKDHLTYTALKTWDMATYMHHAELQLYHVHKPVAYAKYHLRGQGGLSLNKWGSVESKMNPVIDELLANYSPEKVDNYRAEVHDCTTQDQIETETSKKLRQLKAWYEEGLINNEEYQKEKQKVLNRLIKQSAH